MRSTGRPRRPSRSSGEAGSSGVRAADRRRAALPAGERAAADLLAALGAELDAERLRETRRRVAPAYAELLTPRPFNPTTFPNDERYDQLVVAEDVPFQSLCAHHLLPFHGRAHRGAAGRVARGGRGAVGPAAARLLHEAAGPGPFPSLLLGGAGRLCLDRPALAPIARVPEHPLVPARGGEATASTRTLRWAELEPETVGKGEDRPNHLGELLTALGLDPAASERIRRASLEQRLADFQ
jgi:GTP cyclohydrolase I